MMKHLQPKMFRNDVILSAIRGYLLVENFGDVHECLDHMAGRPLFIHELPSFFGEAMRRLYEDE